MADSDFGATSASLNKVAMGDDTACKNSPNDIGYM
jgi:hypothetical protein